MSVPHGCNNDTAVVDSFKEALKQRIGAERYQMWFAHGVQFEIELEQAQIPESPAAISESPTAIQESPAGQSANLTSEKAALRDGSLFIRVRGQFALERIRNNFLPELRGAAMQACDGTLDVQLVVDEPPATQASLPLREDDPDSLNPVSSNPDSSNSVTQESVSSNSSESNGRSRSTRTRQAGKSNLSGRRRRTQSLTGLMNQRAGTARKQDQPTYANTSQAQFAFPSFADDAKPSSKSPSAKTPSAHSSQPAQSKAGRPADPPRDRRATMNAETFVSGSSNQLAYTAMAMVCGQPGSASPLFVSGPTGTGKTHLLHAIADQFRRRHRMRRVMHLSAEQFTNDFINSVGNSGITSFRRRYREVDALLVDDIQFLGSKQATLREMLYTVETLAAAGRPLVFSALQSPTDIAGLSRELAGRLASGLVCPVQPLDADTRGVILRRLIQQRCRVEMPSDLIERLVPLLAGDGRVISGVVNLINTLERMNHRVPTMDELRHFGGELLRASGPIASLSVIEMAVCETFGLSQETLRGRSQTRAVTQPRMLAMYLSRQLTSSAYTEIAKHFGGKSHSTAIQAEKNVKDWLANEKSIGRGQAAMGTQEAINRVESLLRTGS